MLSQQESLVDLLPLSLQHSRLPSQSSHPKVRWPGTHCPAGIYANLLPERRVDTTLGRRTLACSPWQPLRPLGNPRPRAILGFPRGSGLALESRGRAEGGREHFPGEEWGIQEAVLTIFTGQG